MKRAKIAELKEKVNCGALLERAGFAVDVKESTRRAVKYRRGGEIVIVTHEGKGWFDPLSDDKGDIFTLAQRLDHVGFAEGLETVAALVGFQTSDPVWEKTARERPATMGLAEQWRARRTPWCPPCSVAASGIKPATNAPDAGRTDRTLCQTSQGAG